MEYLARVGGEVYTLEECFSCKNSHYEETEVDEVQLEVRKNRPLVKYIQQLVSEFKDLAGEHAERVNLLYDEHNAIGVNLATVVNGENFNLLVEGKREESGKGEVREFQYRNGRIFYDEEVLPKSTLVKDIFPRYAGFLNLAYVCSPETFIELDRIPNEKELVQALGEAEEKSYRKEAARNLQQYLTNIDYDDLETIELHILSALAEQQLKFVKQCKEQPDKDLSDLEGMDETSLQEEITGNGWYCECRDKFEIDLMKGTDLLVEEDILQKLEEERFRINPHYLKPECQTPKPILLHEIHQLLLFQ